MDGLIEFEPGKLPAGLDLGDEFVFENKKYLVRATSSGGWIRAKHIIEPPATPVPVAALLVEESSTLLAEPAEPALEEVGELIGGDERPAIDREYGQVIEAVEVADTIEVFDLEYGQRIG